VPPEQKRIIQSREAEPDRGGSPVGAAIFCFITVLLFVGALVSQLGSRRPEFLILVPLGALALAGIAGVAYQFWAGSDSNMYGPVPLEVESTVPADGTHWRAMLKLPKAASAEATVHAEIICSAVTHTRNGMEESLLWGKGSSFGIRSVYGEGSAALVFTIPHGLPRSETPDWKSEHGRSFGKWELKVTAGSLERNYDLDIQPADGTFVAAGAAPIAAQPEPGPAAIDAPEDELADQPPDTSSVWVLVAANLVLVAGVAFWGWRVKDVIVLYLIETLVVGAFNVPAILIAVPRQMSWLTRQGIAPSDAQLVLGKVGLAAFFVLHFGIFCFVGADFLSALLQFDSNAPGSKMFWPLFTATLHDPHALAAIGAITASHGYTFLHDYVGRGEYRHADLKIMMLRPYRRVVVTQGFILAGGAALLMRNSPVVVIALFVVVKIAVDIYYHYAERKNLSAESARRAII